MENFDYWIVTGSSVSHLQIENRKASMDCLEEQSKVAENFKS